MRDQRGDSSAHMLMLRAVAAVIALQLSPSTAGTRQQRRPEHILDANTHTHSHSEQVPINGTSGTRRDVANATTTTHLTHE